MQEPKNNRSFEYIPPEKQDEIEQNEGAKIEQIRAQEQETEVTPEARFADERRSVERRRNRSMTRRFLLVGLIGAVLGGLVIGLVLPYVFGGNPQAVFSQQTAGGGTVTEIVRTNGVVAPATAVSRKLQPSVVNVSISAGPNDPIHSGINAGVGSGVIYSSDGYIITNNHVVEGADNVTVTVVDDELPAQVVATDPETDIAVLKVNRQALQEAELGSTKDLEVGEPVIAIGSPFGFERTVTSGIVSALNRNVTVPNEQTGESISYTDLIQTDAAINPGNSGGALSDASGKVIGINTLILSATGQNEGVGFAIPIELATKVADQLIEKGVAEHPFMGIGGRDLIDAPAGAFRDLTEGVVITEVTVGGPADKAGLLPNDIVIEADGEPVASIDDLIGITRQKNVGDTLRLTYIRNSVKRTSTLTLIDRPQP